MARNTETWPRIHVLRPWSGGAARCALLVSLVSLVGSAHTNTDPSDHPHRGDLHLVRGSNVHSLAWVVEVAGSCSVVDVIRGFNKGALFADDSLSPTNSEPKHGNSQDPNPGQYYFKDLGSNVASRHNRSLHNVSTSTRRNKSYSAAKKVCHSTVPAQLILLKKLNLFKNVYVIAHPYFRLYSQKKRRRRARERLIVQRERSNSTDGKNGTPPPPTDAAMFLRIEACVKRYFADHACVVYAQQEVLRPRQKRSRIEFHDPLFQDQWHLKNPVPGQYDINVFGVWESGITGRGVTVCVIDDGLEWRHPDLRDNYNQAGSYDLNSDDPDPSPVKNGERNEHGTRCAGEIAAVTNNICGVGVAYRANISGVRVLSGRMTDSMEAAAFIQGLDVNDIYSCSWGPDDDGKTVDGPHHLASRALVHGVMYGRRGYGSIYVVASGNGGRNKDNCNFDGYANSVYTVTIGAVDVRGRMPFYAEECAAMLAVTPSSGGGNNHDIVTTDWTKINPSGCTKHHTGTSAAAPLAAAVIALALEVQPCLSWRDVQYLIALTAKKIDVSNSDWAENGAGLHHSHQHGFGLIDAMAMVSAAAVWESIPFSTSYTSDKMVVKLPLPEKRLEGVTVKHTVDKDLLDGYALNILEFVQVRVTVHHDYRGSLRIVLVCPSGTKSTLVAPRDADNSTTGLDNWPLGTVRCWGEDPVGEYQMTVMHTRHHKLKGELVSWQLILHGCSMTPQQLQTRRNVLRRAVRGEAVHVNRSTLCHPPELRFEPFQPVPDRWLKVLAITGFFVTFMVAFNTAEYILCYNDEKEKFYRKLRDVSVGRAIHQRHESARRSMDHHHHHHRYGSLEDGNLTSTQESHTTHLYPNNPSEILPLMVVDREASPSPSCDADISSLDCDSDEDNLSSHHTSDTVIPKDTDATDFTNDEFLSEIDDDRKVVEGPGPGFTNTER